MEELLEIMRDLIADDDFENNDDLVESGILDSMTILNLISEIDDQMGVEIPVGEVIPENFKSVSAIMALIEKIRG